MMLRILRFTLCSASVITSLASRELGSAKFKPVCISEKLNPGEELHRNEVIGPSWNCKDGGYRLGLDKKGWLAYWTFDDKVGWWPGVQGDTLKMERNGNLVLYEDNEVVWESGCYGDDALFQNTGGMIFGEVVNANGEVIWRINDSGQESKCYPGNLWSSETKVKCRGNILGSNVRLLRGEYICGLSGHHRFGMNAQGKLALWHGNRLVWTASQLASGRGDFLAMQSSGKLVLYEERDGENIPKWSTNCKSEGAILEVKDGGVIIEERSGEILWMIDELGVESTDCNPTPTPNVDCSHISNYGNTCQVQMIDRFNTNIVNIQVNDLGDNKFEIIDNVDRSCGGKPSDSSVKVRKDGKGKVVIDAGVPEVSCKKMLKNYPMKDDSQLIWLRDDTMTCSKFGESLIYFMVEEWFYFG
mmetsp:Transcript_31692/g.94834  ORF Transcript_31692/g.94834 Transcript_31692/m.94834 type:complete len:415 (-) Transcript_31692:164-1408(-)